MAARILAQVAVAAGTVLFRAASQAWGQALANAQKTGVASEAVKGATKVAGQMSLQEAQMILGVEQSTSWGEVMKRYRHLFEVNEKHGSFYLTSKVYRAKEALEAAYEEEGRKTGDEGPDPAKKDEQPQQQQQQQQQSQEQQKQ